MKKNLTHLLLVAGIGITTLTACTQMPTEKQGVTDLRPQLSFKLVADNLENARVLIDGLDMGAVGDYQEGKAALRILPGNHLVRIDLNGRPIVEDKVYIGDGVSRTILVK